MNTIEIAGKIFDLYDDVNHDGLRKIASSIPTQYTNTKMLSEDQLNALSDNQFALVGITKRGSVVRRFPLNDAGNTFVSSQYFEINKHKIPQNLVKEASDRIERAMTLYKVSSFDKMASALTNPMKSEIYAMPDTEKLAAAQDWFTRNSSNLTPEDRRIAALSITERANQLNVDTSNDIKKYAGEEFSRNISAAIEMRKGLLPEGSEFNEKFDKLASLISNTTPDSFALALKELDERAGLTRYYDGYLNDSFADSTQVKEASDYVNEVDGHTVTGEQLKKVSSVKMAQYFGSTMAKQFESNPVEIYSSLPSPEKAVIAQIATGVI